MMSDFETNCYVKFNFSRLADKANSNKTNRAVFRMYVVYTSDSNFWDASGLWDRGGMSRYTNSAVTL